MDLPSKTYLNECRKASPRTVTRNCEMWFEAIYDNQSVAPPEPLAGPIEAGKVYTYLYDPKHANDLPYYDTFPMFMSLGHLENGNIIGINLSYVPPRVRLRVLDKFIRVFNFRFIKGNQNWLERGKPGAMKEIPFFYDVAKVMLAGSGFENALRSYRYDHIHSSPQIITYDDYWRLLAITSKHIEKLNIRAIYALYKRQPIGTKDKKVNIDPRVRPTQRHIKNRKP